MSSQGFTHFFIRRPALTVVISLLLIVVGVVSHRNLPVRWVPAIQPPIVAIYTGVPGASADLVETRVTTPIEAALSGVDGIETLSSGSQQGASSIVLHFQPGHNLNTAMEDVRGALQSVSASLPAEADTPIVQKADPGAAPIMVLAFSSERLSARALSDYVRQFLLPRIQSVEGVAAVAVYGSRDSVMHIGLDPVRMAATGVTVTDVSEALSAQNVSVPSGSIRGKNRNYPVAVRETLKSPSAFNTLIVRNEKGLKVRLRDVGSAVLEAGTEDSAFRVNGRPAVALAITPQSTANPLEVSARTEAAFSALQRALPFGMTGKVVFSAATWIHSSVDHVYVSLIEAILLVLAVVYFFLGQVRAALIPLVTIPVCLTATFAIMRISGVTINTVTLMALVLAIGLVVDDAIVMLENIRRHIEEGERPLAAAVTGSREMIFPVIAMTLTLAAVYAPAAFVPGITGTVFREFAVTLAGSVLVSGFVALTLSPMMCARLLQPQNTAVSNRFAARPMTGLQTGFERLLKWAFANPLYVLIALGITAAVGLSAFHQSPRELMPAEDMDEIDAYISAPRNASFSWMDARVQRLDQICAELPGVDSCLSQSGFSGAATAMQIITLKPRSMRSQDLQTLLALYLQKAGRVAGLEVNAVPASSPLSWYSAGDGSSVVMKIMSPVAYRDLYTLTQRFLEAARSFPGFVHVDNTLKWDSEQFELNVDREKTADMQVSMSDITQTLSVLLAGRTHGYFERGGNLYDITLQMNRHSLADVDVFSRIYVRNRAGKMLSLAGLATVHEITAPPTLPHFDRLRTDTVRATLRPGVTIAAAVQALQQAAAVLPDNAHYAFVGEARSYLESGGEMIFIFALALVFIYLALVAQFESFVDPLIVLLTVPFALTGALITLRIAGGSLNLYSEIALVTLVGLIAKHGILVTEFANRLRLDGYSPRDAALRAVRLRLRPVMMTTAAMVLGALPLAWAWGAGAETRHQVGWVIVGGLVPGTFFSLVVVPFAWVWLAELGGLMEKDTSDEKVSV